MRLIVHCYLGQNIKCRLLPRWQWMNYRCRDFVHCIWEYRHQGNAGPSYSLAGIIYFLPTLLFSIFITGDGGWFFIFRLFESIFFVNLLIEFHRTSISYKIQYYVYYYVFWLGSVVIRQLSNACKRWTVWREDCFRYLGSQVAADGGCERDVVHRMNEGCCYYYYS